MDRGRLQRGEALAGWEGDHGIDHPQTNICETKKTNKHPRVFEMDFNNLKY